MLLQPRYLFFLRESILNVVYWLFSFLCRWHLTSLYSDVRHGINWAMNYECIKATMQ